MRQVSWVESAHDPDTDFPLENLPYGVFEASLGPRIGNAIGDQILDLKACADAGLLDALDQRTVAACGCEALNALMALGRTHWSALRERVTELLTAGSAEQDKVESLLVPMQSARMRLPAVIGDYTDFFANLYHATNAGQLFRPGSPLPLNYKYVPLGYHGRASSMVVSGTPVWRPWGQILDAATNTPRYAACRDLDYECEVGTFVGPGNALGEPIPIADAESHIFGLCLLNDWSARDMQIWESQPLGPFLSKSLMTSLSPWVVTREALEPFRVPAFRRDAGDPAPLPYLFSPADQERGGIDVTLEVYLASAKMRATGVAPLRVSRGNFRDLYWTVAQLLTHHTSNGCNLRPGDLLGSGTVSGTARDSLGCLLEYTRRGTEAFRLPTGEERRYLEDGDEVIFRGYCERGPSAGEDAVRIGFGECRGRVAGAR
ncbi:MAG: fumarylacetoacetase [Bryobacterales bacterium]|nr:fumarylacetoacetase [Bryobacterales bacterium]